MILCNICLWLHLVGYTVGPSKWRQMAMFHSFFITWSLLPCVSDIYWSFCPASFWEASFYGCLLSTGWVPHTGLEGGYRDELGSVPSSRQTYQQVVNSYNAVCLMLQKMCAPRPQHPWASSGELCVWGVFFLGVPALEEGEKAQGWGPRGTGRICQEEETVWAKVLRKDELSLWAVTKAEFTWLSWYA